MEIYGKPGQRKLTMRICQRFDLVLYPKFLANISYLEMAIINIDSLR